MCRPSSSRTWLVFVLISNRGDKNQSIKKTLQTNIATTNQVKKELPCLSHVVLIGDRRKFLSCLVTLKLEVDNVLDIIPDLQGVPKKHTFRMLLEPQCTGTPCVWKLIFWSFLTRTKPDQAFPSHFHGKIQNHDTQFGL